MRHVRQRRMAGIHRVTDCARAHVAIIRRVRQLTDTAGIQNRQKNAFHFDSPLSIAIKAPPHNSAARLSMSFPPSAACKFLDLPPVNLRNLHLHLTKKSIRQPTTSFVRCYLNFLPERSFFYVHLPQPIRPHRHFRCRRSLPSLRLFLHHLLLPRKQLLPPAPH